MDNKMTMNEKMRQCFKPHVLMHSLFGLGLGLLVASLVVGQSIHHARALLLVGVACMVVSVGLDVIRKS